MVRHPRSVPRSWRIRSHDSGSSSIPRRAEERVEERVDSEKIEFYVPILNIRHSCVNWYVIDWHPNISLGKEFEFKISKVDMLYKHRKFLFTNYASVSFKSKICLLGGTVPSVKIIGSPKPHNKVFVYDTLSGRLFKSSTSMKCARDFHVATVVSATGEIYVFGHKSYEVLTIEQWAEYYSPQEDAWNYLPPPPQDVEDCMFYPDGIALHEPTQTIYLWQFGLGFVSYCYSTKLWNFRKTRHCPCSSSPVIVGDILFYKSYHDEIYAYDLVSQTILRNPKDDPEPLSDPRLVYCGHDVWGEITCNRAYGELKLEIFRFTPQFGERTSLCDKTFYIGPENSLIENIHKLTRHVGEFHEDEVGWMEMTIKDEEVTAGRMEILEIEEVSREVMEGTMEILEIEEVMDGKMEIEEVSKGDMQETLMLIYDTGVKSKFVGGIIRVFEEKGFKLKGLYLVVLDERFAEDYCWDIQDNTTYHNYLNYLTSAPTVVIIWEGINVVTEVVKTLGPLFHPRITEVKTTGSTSNNCTLWIIDKDDYPMEIRRDAIDYCDSLETARTRISWFRNGPHILGSDIIHLDDCGPEAREQLTCMELALVMINPEFVVKGCVGAVICVFEEKGFFLKGMRLIENSTIPSSSEGSVAMIWKGINVVKHIEKTIHAGEMDIFASWIKVKGSLVKINSEVIHLEEDIESYFTIKVKATVGMNGTILEFIFE